MDNAPVTSQAPEVEAAPQERMLSQSTVNELIGTAKREAAEKAAARAVEEYKRQQADTQAPAQSYNSQRALSEDDVKRLTGEELNRQKSEWERQTQERMQAEAAERIVKTYNDKIASGKDKYQDFETVTNNINMAYYPNVVQLLAEHVDNASDILYNLAQRRGKLDELDRLFERNAHDAVYEIKRLSESIKANEASNQVKTSRQPLSQQRPSNTGTDSGPLSIADYKRLYRG
jgi:hypothetical protein